MSILDEIDQDLDSANQIKKKKRRKKHEREADRVKVSEMYLAGKSQYQIGQALNLSQSQVSTELAIVRENWIKQTSFNLDQIKAEQLIKIDWLEKEAREAWERSKRIKKTSTKRLSLADRSGNKRNAPLPTSMEILEEEELGDPRYYEKLQWCIEQRLKICGGYAAKKLETEVKGHIQTTNVDKEEILSWLDDLASKSKTNPQQNLLEPVKNYVDAEVVEEPEEEKIEEEVIEGTYQLIGKTKGLLCFRCNQVTWSTLDFQNRFCPTCELYHEDSDMQKVDEDDGSEQLADPTKLNIIDYNSCEVRTPEVNTKGTAQEHPSYNKKHDANVQKDINDLVNNINFGKSEK